MEETNNLTAAGAERRKDDNFRRIESSQSAPRWQQPRTSSCSATNASPLKQSQYARTTPLPPQTAQRDRPCAAAAEDGLCTSQIFPSKAAFLCSTAMGVAYFYFLYRRHRNTFLLPYEQQRISAFSEGAFYFSFFHDFVDAPSWRQGLELLLRDARSEHPDVINALGAFNIYQELLCGISYRLLRFLLGADHLQLLVRTPFNFYMITVFMVQGVGLTALSLFAAVLGESPFCSVACSGFFFANYYHRLIARVSAVPQRENWAIPWLWINFTCLVLLLRLHAKKQQQQQQLLRLLGFVEQQQQQFVERTEETKKQKEEEEEDEVVGPRREDVQQATGEQHRRPKKQHHQQHWQQQLQRQWEEGEEEQEQQQQQQRGGAERPHQQEGATFLTEKHLLIARLAALQQQIVITRRNSSLFFSLYGCSALACLLCWQLAVFAFTTEVAAVFAVYVVGYPIARVVGRVTEVLAAAGAAAFILQFGSRYLLLSLFPAVLVAVYLSLPLQPLFSRWRFFPDAPAQRAAAAERGSKVAARGSATAAGEATRRGAATATAAAATEGAAGAFQEAATGENEEAGGSGNGGRESLAHAAATATGKIRGEGGAKKEKRSADSSLRKKREKERTGAEQRTAHESAAAEEAAAATSGAAGGEARTAELGRREAAAEQREEQEAGGLHSAGDEAAGAAALLPCVPSRQLQQQQQAGWRTSAAPAEDESDGGGKRRRSVYGLLSLGFLRGVHALLLCAVLRFSLSTCKKEDAHVYEMLLTKFGLLQHSFDTLIYLLGEGVEFNFFSSYFFKLVASSHVFLWSFIGLTYFLLLSLQQLLPLHSLYLKWITRPTRTALSTADSSNSTTPDTAPTSGSLAFSSSSSLSFPASSAFRSPLPLLFRLCCRERPFARAALFPRKSPAAPAAETAAVANTKRDSSRRGVCNGRRNQGDPSRDNSNSRNCSSNPRKSSRRSSSRRSLEKEEEEVEEEEKQRSVLRDGLRLRRQPLRERYQAAAAACEEEAAAFKGAAAAGETRRPAAAAAKHEQSLTGTSAFGAATAVAAAIFEDAAAADECHLYVGARHGQQQQQQQLTPDYLYFFFQTLLFGLMMLLFARLRVLCLPLLCVSAAVALASPRFWQALLQRLIHFFNFLFARIPAGVQERMRAAAVQLSAAAHRWGRGRRRKKISSSGSSSSKFLSVRRSLQFLLFSLLSLTPFYIKLPLDEFLSPLPEAENAWTPSRQQLLSWLTTHLPADTAIFSDMTTSAMLRAGSNFRVVVHPQYERTKVRERVRMFYATAACPPERYFAEAMHAFYHTNYLLLNIYRCAVGGTRSVFDVADALEDSAFRCPTDLQQHQRFCYKVPLRSAAFRLVYRNAQYSLLQRVPPRQKQQQQEERQQTKKRLVSPDLEQQQQQQQRQEEEDVWRTLKRLRSDEALRAKDRQYRRYNWLADITNAATFEPWLQRCVKEDPHCSSSVQGYAQVLLDIYHTQQAAALLQERAIKLFTREAEAEFAFAKWSDFDLQQPAQALQHYKRAAHAEPYDFEKVVQLVLFVDQTYGKAAAAPYMEQLVRLAAAVTELQQQQRLLPRIADEICMAAVLLQQLLHFRQAAEGKVPPLPAEESHRVERAIGILWNKAKELNIQQKCVVESWALMEGEQPLSLLRRVQHFFFGEMKSLKFFLGNSSNRKACGCSEQLQQRDG